MRAPFARTPGRRRWPRRFAPELCVAAIYGLGLLVLLIPCEVRNARLLEAAGLVYGLSGLLLVIVPIGVAALALASERDRGTLESLILASGDARGMIWGRFLRVLLPWSRVLLYLLPTYLVMSASEIVHSDLVRQWNSWQAWAGCVFLPKPLVVLAQFIVAEFHLFDVPASVPFKCTFFGLSIIPFRMLNDFSLLCFACGVAYFFSAHSKSGGRALLLGYLLVPAGLVVMTVDAWWLPFAFEVLDFSEDTGFVGYCIIAFGLMVCRFGVTFLLVRRVVRNFDRYALGKESAL